MEISTIKRRKTTHWKAVAKQQAQHALDALHNADACAQEAAHWKSVATRNGRVMWAAVLVAAFTTLYTITRWILG